MNIRHSLAPLALAALLSACASPVKYDTPSGKPEAIFPGVSAHEVSQEIVLWFTRVGATLVKQSPNQLVFQQKSASTLDSVLLGTRYDFAIYDRVRVTLYETGDGTGVLVECAIVQNSGSAFEREHDATHGQRCKGTEHLFELMRRDFAAR